MKDKENIILIVSATRLFAAKEDNKMTAGKHETSNKAFSQQESYQTHSSPSQKTEEICVFL